MNILGFILGLALTGAALSSIAALVVALAALGARASGRQLPSAAQADVALFAGLLPAVVGVGGALLAAVPAVLASVGLLEDHCLDHGHHGHLCPEHLGAFPPWMAVLGAAAGAAGLARAGFALAAQRRRSRLLNAAVAVGVHQRLDDGTTLVVLDGPPTLLHAGGGLVLASRALLDQLGHRSRRAALAHEAAHVRRGDGGWLSWLALAAAFAPPGFGAVLQRCYRQAAEEAADEEAAVVVGAVDVAAAVVEVARLRLRSGAPADLEALPAIDAADIERRVARLLVLVPRARSSCAGFVIGALLLGVVAAVPFADDVHHAVETVMAHAAGAHDHAPAL
ncbi:MAG: hypothetical protein Q8O67_08570 [Deltaproteobacteria bacterium]|nr:hypothetical protein [Deltaproteobacteria bacterium]